MKKNGYLIILGIGLVLITPFVFFFLLASDMISTNKAKPLDTGIFSEYKTYIKKDFSEIDVLLIYYQAGCIHFKFTLKNETTIDVCKAIVKKTKEFIENEGVELMLDDSLNIEMTFNDGKHISEFSCPYWLPHEENAKNYLKLWYVQFDGQPYPIYEP